MEKGTSDCCRPKRHRRTSECDRQASLVQLRGTRPSVSIQCVHDEYGHPRADGVGHLYRGRADVENRIRELKYDFALEGFCMKSFWATEAVFRTIMLAYNLVRLFRHPVLQTQRQQTLMTLKVHCFAIGSWIVTRGSKRILKLSVAMQKRQWIDGLF
jgi:hypothetical protein